MCGECFKKEIVTSPFNRRTNKIKVNYLILKIYKKIHVNSGKSSSNSRVTYFTTNSCMYHRKEYFRL